MTPIRRVPPTFVHLLLGPLITGYGFFRLLQSIREPYDTTSSFGWFNYALAVAWLIIGTRMILRSFRTRGVPAATYDSTILKLITPEALGKPQITTIPITAIKKFITLDPTSTEIHHNDRTTLLVGNSEDLAAFRDSVGVFEARA